MTAPLHVAVGVIADARGRVLLAKRPAHVHQGDLWEFPGGKVEPGESVQEALARELWEELHIRLLRVRPLIRVPHRYPDRAVLLDVWRVDAYSGSPVGREGQPLAWVEPARLDGYPLPAANTPIVRAVRLPSEYVISAAAEQGVETFLQQLGQSLARGAKLIQLRPLLDENDPAYGELVRRAIEQAHTAGAQVLLNGRPEAAQALGADGVHLNGTRAAALTTRPLPPPMLVGVSCHNAEELAHAAAIEADFAVLSPVAPTPSHPHATVLGWQRFAALVDTATLPVYALGGVGPEDLPRAWQSGAQGVAGISAFWGAATP